jgi:hypothetical protein
MAETPDKGIGEAINRQKEIVAKEVEQHKVEDVDLEDVSGGWTITYTTDPATKQPLTSE